MAAPTKPKKKIEQALAITSTSETGAVALLIGQVADDPESSLDLKATATLVRHNLERSGTLGTAAKEAALMKASGSLGAFT